MGFSPAAIVCLVLAASCAATSGYFTHKEIEEINRKLPKREQVEYAFMYPGKMERIGHHYKQLYPEGSTNRWRLVFQVAAFLFLGLTAIAVGFLR
jgi:hypothetical protein